MPNLLIEIGTEELPTDALDILYQHLKTKAEETLKKNRVAFSAVQMEATPRRIALYIEGLPLKQEDEALTLSGPSVEKAYDSEGKPTAAFMGFLKSKDARPEDAEVTDTPRGKFVVLRRLNKGKAAASVLPQVLQEIFTSLSFPKNMRWEPSGFRFPRPIRWAAAVLDKKIIPFSIGNIKAGNTSYGHRFLAPKAFKVLSADWSLYKKALRKAYVILDLEERKEFVRKGLQGKFKQKHFDEELLHTAAQLVEMPFLLEGGFAKEYLQLPKEVLASCMKKNQKIFACYDANGKLQNKFVAVLNGARSAAALPRLRKDYENVLESRLKDARYFYEADTKEKLETKLPLLEQVTYLGKLGNMKQKTERLEKLAEIFQSGGIRKDKLDDLRRAARLSKIDLMTHLVYEFPDLQGIVGREYARISGENPEVAKAVGSQYLPKSLSENHSELTRDMNDIGAMFGVIDRLDHLVGAFGTGIQVSGSQDPYALRRAGGSLVKIVRAFNLHFSLGQAIDQAAGLYGRSLSVALSELKAKLVKFLEERVVFEMQTRPSTKEHEILLAVVRTGFDDLADVYERYDALRLVYQADSKAFLRAAKVVERTGNIIKGANIQAHIRPEAFTEDSERALYRLLTEKGGEIREADYRKATTRFGEIFYEPLHAFFSQVMVNVEDPAIRGNRQALMKQINDLYTRKIADLSLLSGLDSL